MTFLWDLCFNVKNFIKLPKSFCVIHWVYPTVIVMSLKKSYLSVFFRNNCVIAINTRASRVAVAALDMPKLFDAIDDQLLRERINRMALKRGLNKFLLIYVVGGKEISYEAVSLPELSKVATKDTPTGRCLPDHLRPYLQRMLID